MSGSRHPTLRLQADAQNVAVARSFVVAGLAVLDVDEAMCEKARLVTSELVTQLIPTGEEGDDETSPAMILVELITEGPAIRIAFARPVPELPGDVRRIIEALSDVAVEADTNSWTIGIGPEPRGSEV